MMNSIGPVSSPLDFSPFDFQATGQHFTFFYWNAQDPTGQKHFERIPREPMTLGELEIFLKSGGQWHAALPSDTWPEQIDTELFYLQTRLSRTPGFEAIDSHSRLTYQSHVTARVVGKIYSAIHEAHGTPLTEIQKLLLTDTMEKLKKKADTGGGKAGRPMDKKTIRIVQELRELFNNHIDGEGEAKTKIAKKALAKLGIVMRPESAVEKWEKYKDDPRTFAEQAQ